MPEESAAERTEEATQRKRQQSREQGTVSRSRDLAAAVVLLASVLFLRLAGEWMFERMLEITGSGLRLAGDMPIMPADEFLAWGIAWMGQFLYTLLPMLLVLAAVDHEMNGAKLSIGGISAAM